MNFIRRYAKRNPEKYDGLRKDLRAARMNVYYPVYVNEAFVYAVATSIISFIFLIIMSLISGHSLFEPLFKNMLFSGLLYIIIPVVSGYAVFKLYLFYPKFTAMSRRTKIDVVLPHAVAFCYGMSKGGTPIYEVFKDIAKNPNIYGEASKEFLYIVRDVELLGSDVVTAMKDNARITPSETFREFLENLVPMVESGSNVHEYFSVKMQQYFEHAKKTQEVFIKTLEIICEVYVVAFVAVPIFLLITLVTIGLMGMAQAPYIFHALFIGLPIGSIALIIIIDSISPKEELGMRYINKVILTKCMPIGEEEINEVEYKEKLNKYEKKKLTKKYFKLLKNPFVLIYREPLRALFLSLPLMSLPFLLLNQSLDKQIMLAIIIAIAPLSLAYEYKMRRLSKIDKAVPDFLKRLAEMNEAGLTLRHAIGLLLKSDIGLLSREIKRVWLDMEWGGEMKDALARFENRIGTPALRRAVTLMAKASEVSGNTRDVLLIAADDAQNMISLRNERFDIGFIYMATVYIAFGTFLYVCYSFSMQFLPAISKTGTQAVMNISEIVPTMFATCGILGFFSGLITGQMAEGRLLFGLKHSVILLLATYATFTVLMKY